MRSTAASPPAWACSCREVSWAKTSNRLLAGVTGASGGAQSKSMTCLPPRALSWAPQERTTDSTWSRCRTWHAKGVGLIFQPKPKHIVVGGNCVCWLGSGSARVT